MATMTKNQATRRFKHACVEHIKRHGTIAMECNLDGSITIDGGHTLTKSELDDIVSDAMDEATKP